MNVNRPVKVLVIDDNSDSFDLIRRFLDKSRHTRFTSEWAADYQQALGTLRKGIHDICLCDYLLGSNNGIKLLQEASAFFTGPIILMTAQSGLEVDIEAMRAGAADYLDKAEISSQSLERAIRYALERKLSNEALRISEERLRHAEKMEAVGRLAGGVAHDFNNLMTVIIGHTELLAKRTCDEAQKRGLTAINKAGMRAASLTRQLLAFSRKQILQPRVLDLNAAVQESEEMLRRLIGEDIIISTALAANLPAVHADPVQIQQVIMNLAVNARDAMPHGGRLSIQTGEASLSEEYTRMHPEVESGRYVALEISDNGSGMDAQTREHIFEPFFSTKEPGKGTGLGLATVYGIVKQSGGHIEVFSEPGSGSTFKVYLPPSECAPQKSNALLAAVPAGGNGERILIVEDEEGVRELVKYILSEHGFSVITAPDGISARQACAEHRPHLMLTDVVMPNESGPKLAGELAKLYPKMKVLFMSGYSDAAVVRHGLLTPHTRFLEKPFRSQDLVRMIHEVMEHK